MNTRLNIRQWAVAAVLVFIVMSALEYLLHGIILAPIYEFPVRAGLMRPAEDMSGYLKWVYLGYAFFALYAPKRTSAGVRFEQRQDL